MVGLSLALVILLFGLLLERLSVPLEMVVLALFIGSIVALRQHIKTAGLVILLAIVIDYYQLIALPHGFPWVALLTMVAALTFIFLERTAERPWSTLHDLPWWLALVVLVALAVPRSVSFFGGAIYFINIIVAAFVAWALGTLIIHDAQKLRLLVNLATGAALVIAIHTIIYGLTGVFVLDTPAHAAWLNYYKHFPLNIDGISRAGSFMLNPDSNGAYLGMSFFLPVGLLISAQTWRWRIVHLVEAMLVFAALIFTYTAAAFVAVAGGTLLFLVLAFRPRQLLYALGGVAALLAGSLVFLPEVASRLHSHATGPNELTLREGIWLTALNTIHAHPFLGIGLGIGPVYDERTQAYMSPLQSHPDSHPHNSFLELAAMAGLPVLIVYVVLLVKSSARAFTNYRRADWTVRPLIAGVLAALLALTIHAFADSTWTLPPLVIVGWMLLGAVSSPKLQAALVHDEIVREATHHQPVRFAAGAEGAPPSPSASANEPVGGAP
jgi:O-antigen ligase